MAAERVPQSGESAEIIYLLIPPGAQGSVKAPSVMERLHYRLWLVRESETYLAVANTLHATLGAIGFAVLCCVGLYGLYYLKSMLGIDLFPDLHLEDFVPVPGYHRW